MRLTMLVCAMLLGVPAPLLKLPDTILQQLRILLQPDTAVERPALTAPHHMLGWDRGRRL